MVRRRGEPAGAVVLGFIGQDGSRLASGGGDGRVRVWEAASGEQVRELAGDSGMVWSVGWSPDGSRLASAGDSVLVWDIADGVALGMLIPLTDGWAVLGGDGFTYKYDGTVNGEFWWSVGLCPFPPGDLDPYYPELKRLPAGTPLTRFGPGRDGPAPARKDKARA